MKKIFAINGGAGRVISALPALEKYYKTNGNNFYILAEAGIDFFLGNPYLQDIVFEPTTKGIFENYIKPNLLVSPEPYREHGYYNQKKSLSESFDFLINDTENHSDLSKPNIYLNKKEELNALEGINAAKEHFKKDKIIVIQPFGRTSGITSNFVLDESSRSLNIESYLEICKELSKDYGLIYFGELQVPQDQYTFKVQGNLRQWAALIDAADYFIGCDSVGQHMAYAFNKPGTVIMGSTFEKNVTYPEHFKIYRKPNTVIKYSPIRVVHGMDSELANRLNDTCMDFTEQEIQDLIKIIKNDIVDKVINK